MRRNRTFAEHKNYSSSSETKLREPRLRKRLLSFLLRKGNTN